MIAEAIVAGELYVDLILSGFKYWPRPGEEAFAKSFRREIGGGAAITACGLASLGTATSFFGIAGADHHDWVAAKLAAKGVNTAMLGVDEAEPTGFTVAVTAPHDRAFFTYLGANKRFPGALRARAENGEFRVGSHVHLAYAPPWETGSEIFANIRASGCTVSVDAGWHESWLTDVHAFELLRQVDIFFPNEMEAAKITRETKPERILQRFAECGLPCVALKLGAQGAALLYEGQTWRAAPLPVIPVDTTGAGDCFDAGFLHGWLRGERPEECLRIANICGALSTEHYGGIAGFPSRERLMRELELNG